MRLSSSENCLRDMRTLQGTHIPNIVILLLIIRENLTLQKILTFFQVVTEPWKWGQGHWTCVWQKLRNMRHPYTKYEASRSSTFLNIKLLGCKITLLSDYYPFVELSATKVAGSTKIHNIDPNLHFVTSNNILVRIWTA